MLKGVLAGLTTGALWGLTFVAPRAVYPFTELDLAIARYSIFGIASLMLMIHPQFRPRGIRPANAAVALVLGSAGYVGYFVAASFAVRFAGAAIPPLVIGLLPVCLAVIGNWANADVQWRRLVVPLSMISVGVAITNILALGNAQTESQRQDVVTGIGCSFVALALWIAYGVANAKAMRAAGGPSTLAWTGLQGLGAGLGTLPLVALTALGAPSMLMTEPLGGPAGLQFLGWAIVLGLAGSWVATWCWSIASRDLPLSLSAQLIVAETVFGLLYGFIYEQRWPVAAEWIGILLQLVGVGVAITVFSQPGKQRSATRVRGANLAPLDNWRS
jgi:drug/metabolite transporter (DMT)-like permease